jgi:hypothetical protein
MDNGLAHAAAEFVSVVHELMPASRTGGELYFDLTPDMPERFAVVLTQQNRARSNERDLARSGFLEVCSALGLCTPPESLALQRWGGSRPVRLADGSRVVLERWLDVKLVWQQGDKVSAKAYLGVGARPARVFDVH